MAIRTVAAAGKAVGDVAGNLFSAVGQAASKTASGSIVAGALGYTSSAARNAVNGINRTPIELGQEPFKKVKFSTAAQNGENIKIQDDWRVRIGLGSKTNFFYNDTTNTLMEPLRETDGVVFPYLPEIVVTHMANYNSASPTHSNYAQQFFNDSQVNDIVITADFTVQNINEGKYLMAAIQFFRSATKMFFGQGRFAGNPPPVVFLNGYGKLYFPNVPCVISNFSQTMSSDVDYIEIPISTEIAKTRQQWTDPKSGVTVPGPFGTYTKENVIQTENVRVPTKTQFTVSVKPVYSRKNLHNNFGLEEFAKGRLLGGDSNGGFI